MVAEPAGKLVPKQEGPGWVGQERPKGPSALLPTEGGLSHHRERKRLGNACSPRHAFQVRRELQVWKGPLGLGWGGAGDTASPASSMQWKQMKRGKVVTRLSPGNSDLGNASSCPVRGWASRRVGRHPSRLPRPGLGLGGWGGEVSFV